MLPGEAPSDHDPADVQRHFAAAARRYAAQLPELRAKCASAELAIEIWPVKKPSAPAAKTHKEPSADDEESSAPSPAPAPAPAPAEEEFGR